MTTTDTKRLSDKLHERATEIAAGVIDNQGIQLSVEDACDFVSWLQQRSAEARKLERMLERRLKVSDIPGGGSPAPANEPGTNLIQFRPRDRANSMPVEGGAA